MSAADGRNRRRPIRNTKTTVNAPPVACSNRTGMKSCPAIEYTSARKYGYSGPMKKASLRST